MNHLAESRDLSQVQVPPMLEILDLGLRSYLEIWNQQKEIHKNIIEGNGTETLIICEHYPVITSGRGAKEGNILIGTAELSKRGVELFHIERGGDVTYHGPGQIVVYPLLDLRKRRQDVGWYMRTLEEVVIRTLLEFGLSGERSPGKTGVWVKSRATGVPAKICAIGVRISRWCTLHGLSINIADCSQGFTLINPCGFTDIRITSMEQEGALTDSFGVGRVLQEKFLELFT